MLLDEPFRGVDLGARRDISHRAREQAERGACVVVRAGSAAVRDRAERAGIVVAQVPGRAAEAQAALRAAGISTTVHGADRIRLSVHATTRSEVFGEASGVLASFR